MPVLARFAALLVAGCLAAQDVAVPEAAVRIDPGRALEEAFDRPLLEDVRNRLNSEQPRTLAWGGYLAGEHGLHELAPLIHDALESLLGERNTVENRCARVVLLDAICRLGADLPGELLEALDLDDVSRPALLLTIARYPKGRQPILLRWFRTGHRRHTKGLYRATGTLLAQDPTPEFVAFLLAEFEITIDISVCDGHYQGTGRGKGGGWGTSGHHRPKLPEAFPPIAVWRFPASPGPGDLLVTRTWSGDGEPVFLRRRVCRKYLDEPRGSSHWSQDDQLLRWLERSASPPGNSSRLVTGLRFQEMLSVDLTTQDFDREVASLTTRWKRGYDKLLRGLAKRGLLPDGRPSMDELFDVHLHDFRAERVGPLVPLVWPREAPVSAIWKTREHHPVEDAK